MADWKILPAQPPTGRTESLVINDNKYAEMCAFRNECEKAANEAACPLVNDEGLLRLFAVTRFSPEHTALYATWMFLDPPSQHRALSLMNRHAAYNSRRSKASARRFNASATLDLSLLYSPESNRDGLCLPTRYVTRELPSYVLLALCAICDDFVGRAHFEGTEILFVVTHQMGYHAFALPGTFTRQISQQRMMRLCGFNEDYVHPHPRSWCAEKALAPPLCYLHVRTSRDNPKRMPLVIGEPLADQGYNCATHPPHLVPIKAFMDEHGQSWSLVTQLCIDINRLCEFHTRAISWRDSAQHVLQVSDLNRPCVTALHTALSSVMTEHRLIALRDLHRARGEIAYAARHQSYPVLTWATRCGFHIGRRALVPLQLEENTLSIE